MKQLTAQQEKFCQAIADGKNQTEAYKLAYSHKNQTDATIWANASRIAADSKVVARVSELRAKLEDKALWSREDSVRALQKIAEGSDKGSEIVAAVKELNAMHGYQAPAKAELKVTGGLVLIPAKNG